MVSRKFSIADSLIYVVLILLALTTVLPLMQVITVSISPIEVNSRFGLHLLPEFDKITFEAYQSVLKYRDVWTGYWNTFVRTSLGLALSLVLYTLGAYPLSKRYLPNRRFWNFFIIFTLYFNGGLIPTYILLRNLGMLDKRVVMIIPPAVSGFTLIILRNFFTSIPEELEESALIDGAGPLRILFQIVVPLSKPVLATVSLWTIVYHWNEWFSSMIYITDKGKWVLQYILRRILLEGQVPSIEDVVTTVSSDAQRMATLVVATLPIICIYPFLQKYFVKGILIGSVKG